MNSKDSDYHIHTYYSDGTLSPAEVVAWAKEKGLSHMAITDHDGVGGLAEGAAAARDAGIDFTYGIELSTLFEGRTGLHILGYNIDPEDEALKTACEKIRIWREERNEKLLAALAEEGYSISQEYLPGSFISKPAMARAMTLLGYIKEPKEAFDNIFSMEKMRKIPKQKIDSYEAIDLILGAGGMAVLAHPGLIRHKGERGSEEFFANVEEIIQKLAAHGMGGLECCYSKHSEEEEIEFSRLAEKYDLIITRGSDYHGPEHRR